ncbi:uncharacterized protein IWZ02DRAFT_253520 [Phyllosticta citriasiana]|uniref:uncharacterized protein n=1 Tax=Phyllosticta citriasiana TaxID=595635 RepID=UPI0030FDC3F0
MYSREEVKSTGISGNIGKTKRQTNASEMCTQRSVCNVHDAHSNAHAAGAGKGALVTCRGRCDEPSANRCRATDYPQATQSKPTFWLHCLRCCLLHPLHWRTLLGSAPRLWRLMQCFHPYLLTQHSRAFRRLSHPLAIVVCNLPFSRLAHGLLNRRPLDIDPWEVQHVDSVSDLSDPANLSFFSPHLPLSRLLPPSLPPAYGPSPSPFAPLRLQASEPPPRFSSIPLRRP